MKDALLILDWGIGGIGAFIEIRKKNPDLDILYWSDSGALPYGKMEKDELGSRILKVLATASALGATHALIACNAASTILPFIDPPIPTLGVIREGVKRLIRDKQNGHQRDHIGIIGGGRTIESGAWSQPLIEEGFRVSSKSAQPLSALIESGKHFDPTALPVFESVLNGLDDVTDLVLACTHYVVASKVISSILPNATLFDPVAESLNFIFENWNLDGAGSGQTRFLTSGNIEEMESSTKLAYGLDLNGLAKPAPPI